MAYTYQKPTKAFTYSTPNKAKKAQTTISGEYKTGNVTATALSYQDWKDEKYATGANSDTEDQLQSKYLTYAKNFA